MQIKLNIKENESLKCLIVLKEKKKDEKTIMNYNLTKTIHKILRKTGVTCCI